MTATFGIVIQGPLRSQGWSCHANLERLLALMPDRARFSCCLSTWRTEETAAWEKDERMIVVKNDPPSGRDYHNRRKQIWSTLQGALALVEKKRSDYLIKIRTDQFIDLKALIAHLEKISNVMPARGIVAPAMSRFIPFYVADFYFAGRTEAMLAYCRNILSWGENLIQNHIEIDFTLKHLQIELKNQVGDLSERELYEPLFHYPYLKRRPPLYQREWNTWREVQPQFFQLFPIGIFQQMEWRGKVSLPQKDDFLPNFVFAQDDTAALPAGECPYSEPPLESRLSMKLMAWEYFLAYRWNFAPRELGRRLGIFLSKIKASIEYRLTKTPRKNLC